MKTWFSITDKADATKPAEISIFDEIGAWGVSAKDFIGELRAIDSDAISLSINSPGGSVFDALAIYNALRQHKAQVTVKVLGVAASAASLIAMAGNRIVMPENAFMMVHNPLNFAYGNADDLREMADLLDKIGASLVATYVARTGKSEDEVKALLAAETWLSAAEAVALGFADEVEPALRVAAAFDLDRLPENVRAAITPAKPAPAPQPAPAPAATLAERINALARAGGLEQYADHFALSCESVEAAEAAIGTAREIVALCAVARLPDLAAGFITDSVSLAEARAKVIAARAASAPPVAGGTGGTGGESYQVPAGRHSDPAAKHEDGTPAAADKVSFKAIYAARQAANTPA